MTKPITLEVTGTTDMVEFDPCPTWTVEYLDGKETGRCEMGSNGWEVPIDPSRHYVRAWVETVSMSSALARTCSESVSRATRKAERLAAASRLPTSWHKARTRVTGSPGSGFMLGTGSL